MQSPVLPSVFALCGVVAIYKFAYALYFGLYKRVCLIGNAVGLLLGFALLGYGGWYLLGWFIGA